MGFGRVPLFAVVVALACMAEGRPQSHEQGYENLPVRPFNQANRRESQQSAPVRPFNQMEMSDQGERTSSDSLPVRPFNQYSQKESKTSESLPVRPFSHSSSQQSSQRVVAPFESREVRPGMDHSMRQSSNSNARVQHSSKGEDNPFQSRAHSAPIPAQHGTVQSSGQHHTGQDIQGHRHAQGSNQGSQETPHWTNGQVKLDSKNHQVTSDGRGVSNVQNPSTAPHLRENRRTSPQSQKTLNSRGQQGSKDGAPAVRMGTVEVPAEEKERGKAEGAVNEPANPSFNKEEIVFPGPTRDAGNNNPKLPSANFIPPIGNKNPNCAKGSTFCETFDLYPSDYVKSVLKTEGPSLKEFFGNDLLLNETSIVQRIDFPDENSLCPSKEDIVYPRMAQNKENKWLYVVNQDQYVQGVRVETCLNPESECLLSESFPSGYKTTCRQKFIYRKLLALNDAGKPHSDVFRLPSCCSCFVKSVGGRKRR